MRLPTSVLATIVTTLCLVFGTSIAAIETGSPAPNFTLTDANGTTHSLSDFTGKTVVLEWVNFDCPFVVKHYSQGNMPNLQKQATADGVVWLSINSSAPGKQGYYSGTALTERIAAENWSGTGYLIDSDGTVGKAYSAKTTPHMYIIDAAGTLVYQGAIDDKKSMNPADIKTSTNFVSTALAELAAGAPITTATTKPYGCSVKYAK